MYPCANIIIERGVHCGHHVSSRGDGRTSYAIRKQDILGWLIGHVERKVQGDERASALSGKRNAEARMARQLVADVTRLAHEHHDDILGNSSSGDGLREQETRYQIVQCGCNST